MPAHLAAFFQSTNGLSLAEINVVPDTILTKLTATRFAVPGNLTNVHWAASSATNLTRAFLRTPTLQVRRVNAEIFPRRQSSPLFNLSNLEIFLPKNPLVLTATEDFEVVQSDSAGAAQSHYGLVQLIDAPPAAIPAGDIRIVRATASATLAQGAWTLTTPVADLSLEPGQYTLIGFAPISANCIAARAVISNQFYRPGCIGLAGTEAAASDFDWKSWADINYFPMGSFNHLNFPQFEFLADAADTTEVVYLLVIRTGNALLTPTAAGGP